MNMLGEGMEVHLLQRHLCLPKTSTLLLLLTPVITGTDTGGVQRKKLLILFNRFHSPFRYISLELIIISSVEKIMTSRIFHF